MIIVNKNIIISGKNKKHNLNMYLEQNYNNK